MHGPTLRGLGSVISKFLSGEGPLPFSGRLLTSGGLEGGGRNVGVVNVGVIASRCWPLSEGGGLP